MSEEKIVIHNGSNHAIRTSQGVLPIGGSLAFDPAEAESLMAYRGVRDASKLVPQTADTIDALKRKVAEQAETIKNLEAQVAQLTPNVKEAESSTPESTPEDEDATPKHKAKGRR